MFAASLAMLLFALSTVSAKRSLGLIGSGYANLVRITLATIILGIFAHGWGAGLSGPSLGWFFASGLIGFGICDTAIFLALPRLGAQLTSLMVQCLAAPLAAFTEWAWLGTDLTSVQLAAGATILAGVAVALIPSKNATAGIRPDLAGYGLGLIAAAGQAAGAVISRQGQLIASASGHPIDGLSVAYQRILAGLAFTWLWWLWARRQGIGSPPPGPLPLRQVTPWILLNAFTGPSLGVAAYQWALQIQPTGIVMAIVALTPLAVIPFAWWIEGEKPTRRSLTGGAIAVSGAVWLALHK